MRARIARFLAAAAFVKAPRPTLLVEFFNLWRRELARAPGTMGPSPAWASWLAERDRRPVTITTCAHCRNAVDSQR